MFLAVRSQSNKCKTASAFCRKVTCYLILTRLSALAFLLVIKMRNFSNLHGMVFGRLKVVSMSEKVQKRTAWNCECLCGNLKIVRSDHLTLGRVKSCGCLRVDAKLTHGMYGTRIHHIWEGMKQRCDNKKSDKYHRYGGRGIKYDQSWSIFQNFYKDMSEGYQDGLELDRKDNDLGYSKENCRWSTGSVQAYNRSFDKNNKTGKTGVFEIKDGVFISYIDCNNQRIRLGRFDSKDEAIQARLQAEEKYFNQTKR